MVNFAKPAPVRMRKTIYQKILSSSLAEIDSICDKDAKRTFKSKPYLKTRGHPGTRLVFNISKALGAFFPKAGYCQGRAKRRHELCGRVLVGSIRAQGNRVL